MESGAVEDRSARCFTEGRMGGTAENLAVARRYLKAIEDREIAGKLAEFFAPQAIVETMPNQLVPKGNRDDLAGARRAAESGKKILVSESYEVRNEVASGDLVALEVDWVGTLAVPYETIPAGGQMRAKFAVFLQFKDGKIVEQRNYDCFEPW